MEVIIIEDEPKSLQLLEAALQAYPFIKIVATADSVSKGLSLIRQHQADLIFMDVMIKGGTAFDILEQLHSLDSDIIFTSSHEKYAIQAFRISALDYLLKPVDPEELSEAITKIQNKRREEYTAAHIKLLLSNYRNQDNEREVKIALPTLKGYSFVHPNEIIHCESDNTYTTFYLEGSRQLIVSKTLKSCETMLEPYSFCRVHNRSLINLNHIVEYERGEGGVIRMKDGSEIPVSRRRKEYFLNLFRYHKP